MSPAKLEELAHFKEEMALFPPPNRPTDRHLHTLRWITRLSEKVKCQKPILVGCGAVELFTDAQTATSVLRGRLISFVFSLPRLTFPLKLLYYNQKMIKVKRILQDLILPESGYNYNNI